MCLVVIIDVSFWVGEHSELNEGDILMMPASLTIVNDQIKWNAAVEEM